ncbi:DUF3883 domain-containing protein [Vreelandella aquamarina]
MTLLDYEKRFAALRLHAAKGSRSPHKVAMLLAVIDLMANGELSENRVDFDNTLRQRYQTHFDCLASASSKLNPHHPFFHLRSEGFWHHQLLPGQRDNYHRLTTATSPGVLNAHVAYAYLDEALFELLGNQFARELLKAALLQNLDDKIRRQILRPERSGWDWLECEYLVMDYMNMLEKQLFGVVYSKAGHRRALQPKLNHRSEGSIEFKHQNVSAVLLELGLPYVTGYKPAFNFQQQLKQVVLTYLAGHQSLVDTISQSADKVSSLDNRSSGLTWHQVFDPEPPERIPTVVEPRPAYLARRIDFTERERRNRELGQQAEALVFDLEKQRLIVEGREDLSKEVEWSSRDHGDGLGYDIRSFDAMRDEERFLEVKATQSGKYQPFFISENERAFSNEYAAAFQLYRLYAFGTSPRLFVLPGAIENHVQLLPTHFRARFHR